MILEPLSQLSPDTAASKKAMALNFIGKLLAGSRDSSLPRMDKPWYERFLFECNLAITSTSNMRLSEQGCATLTAGLHLLKAKESEEIFNHLMNEALSPQNDSQVVQSDSNMTDGLLSAAKRPVFWSCPLFLC